MSNKKITALCKSTGHRPCHRPPTTYHRPPTSLHRPPTSNIIYRPENVFFFYGYNLQTRKKNSFFELLLFPTSYKKNIKIDYNLYFIFSDHWIESNH